MRHLFIVTATVAALLATGAFLNRAGAADVGGPPPPPGYGPPYTYGPPRGYGPPPGYGPSDEYSPTPGYNPSPGYSLPDQYGPRPAYGPPSAYGPPPRYNSPDDYGPAPGYLADDDGPQSDYGPTLRGGRCAIQRSLGQSTMRDLTAVSLIAAMVRHRGQAITAPIEMI